MLWVEDLGAWLYDVKYHFTCDRLSYTILLKAEGVSIGSYMVARFVLCYIGQASSAWVFCICVFIEIWLCNTCFVGSFCSVLYVLLFFRVFFFSF